MTKQQFTATFLLSISMFFTGASGLVNEYVLSTVSTYILGSSIEQFSITISIMLGMMGVGSWFQKHISNNNLVEKFIYIEIFLALICSFAPISVYAAFGYLENNFNLIYYLFVMIIGFLIGFEIPFIIRINEKYSKELKTNISTVISADYIGGFIGAFVWVYYLLPNWNLNQISFIVSGTNFLVAFITFIYFIRIGFIKLKIITVLTLFITFFLLILGFINVKDFEVNLEQKLYEDPIVTSKTTKYQHLTLTHNKKIHEYRLYINGNVQFSSLDEKRYHEILVHPIMNIHPNPKNILILGGGDGLALRELEKYKTIKNITLVDLDPGIVQFSSTNKIMKKLNNNAFEDSRIDILNNKNITSNDIKDIYMKDNHNNEKWITSVNVVHIDADKFLHVLKDKKFDIVIIDFPDPSSLELTKLYSKEFFMKIKNVMKDDSIGIIQSTSPYHAKESYLCIGRTIDAANLSTIPLHLNIPAFGDWGWFIFSKKNYQSLLKDIKNVKYFNVSLDYLTPQVFLSSLVFGKNELVSKDKRINTLMKPILLDIYTKNSWLTY